MIDVQAALDRARGQGGARRQGPFQRRLLAADNGGAGGQQAGDDATARAPAPLPWYCEPQSGVLQVSPQPGDALMFW